MYPPFRHAVIEDAPALAELVNDAGDGLPLHLWSKMAAAGESAWDVGRQRAARPEGGFSYRNATIIEHGSECAGYLIGRSRSAMTCRRCSCRCRNWRI